MTPSAFHPEALQEYEAAARYYESRRTGLGLQFIESVESAIQQIVDSPTRWPLLEQDIRRVLVHVFPYAVLYSVEADHVLILAVMHCSREPGYWRKRID